jgi:hypothetical protein
VLAIVISIDPSAKHLSQPVAPGGGFRATLRISIPPARRAQGSDTRKFVFSQHVKRVNPQMNTDKH